jgi:hypothetical protein
MSRTALSSDLNPDPAYYGHDCLHTPLPASSSVAFEEALPSRERNAYVTVSMDDDDRLNHLDKVHPWC